MNFGAWGVGITLVMFCVLYANWVLWLVSVPVFICLLGIILGKVGERLEKMSQNHLTD